MITQHFHQLSSAVIYTLHLPDAPGGIFNYKDKVV